ncbi:hypothetical protein XENORESO_007381, partial [Xenotaenia resolanae]
IYKLYLKQDLNVESGNDNIITHLSSECHQLRGTCWSRHSTQTSSCSSAAFLFASAFFNRVWSLDIEDYSPCSQSEMPDMGWINLVKCSFGMFERRSLLPCGS